jgi:hypothetical protein
MLTASEKYLYYKGHPLDALRLVNDIRETYSDAGKDMPKVLGDFMMNIEFALQEAGYLDQDFNETTPETK